MPTSESGRRMAITIFFAGEVACERFFSYIHDFGDTQVGNSDWPTLCIDSRTAQTLFPRNIGISYETRTIHWVSSLKFQDSLFPWNRTEAKRNFHRDVTQKRAQRQWLTQLCFMATLVISLANHRRLSSRSHHRDGM